MNLNELIEWHLDNAKECRREGEEMQRVFHFNAVALLSELELWQKSQESGK